MLNTIRKSIICNQPLDMIYVSSDGQITKRRVRVYKCDKDFFTAYCYLRSSTRTFKADNVLAVVPVTALQRKYVYCE